MILRLSRSANRLVNSTFSPEIAIPCKPVTNLTWHPGKLCAARPNQRVFGDQSISAKDTLKRLIAEFFGLMIGYIGADVVYETPRGTFGFLELYDKVPLIPALVGLFAVSEAFAVIEGESILTKRGKEAM